MRQPSPNPCVFGLALLGDFDDASIYQALKKPASFCAIWPSNISRTVSRVITPLQGISRPSSRMKPVPGLLLVEKLTTTFPVPVMP